MPVGEGHRVIRVNSDGCIQMSAFPSKQELFNTKVEQQALSAEMQAISKKALAEEVPDQQEPASQMQFSDHDDDDEEEEDDLPQGQPFDPCVWRGGLAVKRPRGYVFPGEEDEDEDEEEILATAREYKRNFQQSLICEEHVGDQPPDLERYFAQWPNMSEFSMIAMCRTFANYKAQKMRALKPAVKKNPRVVKYGAGH